MTELKPVKPCIKCGGLERYAKGNCKQCARALAAASRAANPGRIESWAAANPEKVAASRLARYAKNADTLRARSAAYYAKNKERRKAAMARWQAENPQQASDSRAAWNAANPEARRIYQHNRKESARGGVLSPGLPDVLFILQKGLCPCCGQPLGDNYHLDHIMPLALGGTNTDDNMQLLRQRCNNQKHAKHPIDFMQSRGFLL